MNTETFSDWLNSLPVPERVRALSQLYSAMTVGTRQLFLPEVPKGREHAVIKMLQGINELHHTVANWLVDYTGNGDAFPVDALGEHLLQIATQYHIEGLL